MVWQSFRRALPPNPHRGADPPVRVRRPLGYFCPPEPQTPCAPSHLQILATPLQRGAAFSGIIDCVDVRRAYPTPSPQTTHRTLRPSRRTTPALKMRPRFRDPRTKAFQSRFESILLVKNRPFDSLVVMQFFFLFIFCIVSAKKISYDTIRYEMLF